MGWIDDHSATIGVGVQILMLVVWILYFQLFLGSLQHRVRPKILINRGGGRSLNARCIIANMSAEPIYVEAVIVGLRIGNERSGYAIACSLSDLDLDLGGNDGGDRRSSWYQGPLQSADYLDVGSFKSLIERACDCRTGQENRTARPEDVRRLELTVLATYTAGKRIVAAEKKFEIDDRDTNVIHALSLSTHQITSPWKRRRLVRILET